MLHAGVGDVGRSIKLDIGQFDMATSSPDLQKVTV